MNLPKRALCLFAVPLITVACSASVVIDIPVSEDNVLVEDNNGSLSNGSGQFLYVGNTGQNGSVNSRRTLLRFDLLEAGIPTDSTIINVNLMLRLSGSASSIERTIHLYPLFQNWGEGTSSSSGAKGAAASIGDATWLHTYFPNALWNSAGGDFSETPSASVIVPAITGLYNWSTDDMVADVQDWLDTPSENFGWLVFGDESSNRTAMVFHSRQNNTSPPLLSVTYVPEPFVLSMLCFGGGLLVSRRQVDIVHTHQGVFSGETCFQEAFPLGDTL